MKKETSIPRDLSGLNDGELASLLVLCEEEIKQWIKFQRLIEKKLNIKHNEK